MKGSSPEERRLSQRKAADCVSVISHSNKEVCDIALPSQSIAIPPAEAPSGDTDGDL